MNLGTLLAILLVLMLFGAVPAYNHSPQLGIGLGGVGGVLLLVLVVLLITGRL